MSTAADLAKHAEGINSQGILSSAKGGTGITSPGVSGNVLVSDGSAWNSQVLVVGTSSPTISAIGYGGDDTAADVAGGQTITLTGTNFANGAKVLINTTQVSVVTVVSATQITFTAPVNTAGSYILYVVNTDGSTAIAVPGIQYSGVPAWTTAAGTLGTLYETTAVSAPVAATSNSAVTYSLFSGTLPAGATIASNGTISGTSPVVASSTTYTFVIRATDAELQDTDRSFSLTINPEVVTWATPTNNSTVTTYEHTPISNVTMSATSTTGKAMTYTANSLPTGVTLSGSTISGTPTVAGSSATVLTATAATTNKTATDNLNFVVIPDAVTWATPTNNSTVTTYEYTPISNVTMSATSAAGKSVTYTADSLPTGVTLSGSTISGTPTVAGSSATVLTATAATTNKTATDNLNFVVTPDAVTWATPTNNSTVTLPTAIASSTTLLATSAAGKTVTYTANTLPAGLSIVGSAVTGTPTVSASTSSTFTATAATTGRTTTATINWTISVAGDTYFKNTTLLLSGGTSTTSFIADASVNSFPLTIAGDTKPNSFNPYTPGYYSNYFDGTGDYLVSSGRANIATGEFTIEAWVYPTVLNSINIIFENANWNIGQNSGYRFYIKSTGVVTLDASAGVYNTYPGIYASTNAVLLNKWSHIAVTRDASNVIRCFINGVLDATTATYSTSLNLQTSQDPVSKFGVAIADGGAYDLFNGYISNFRVVNGSGGCLYTTTFTPSTTPLTAVANTKILACQSNRFIDNSTNAYTITKAGDVAIKSFSPFTPNSSYSTYGSGYFDGTGDYLLTPSSSSFGMGTGNFTIEFWYYASSSQGSRTILVGNNLGFTTNAWNIQLNNASPSITNKLQLWAYNLNSGAVVIQGSTTLAPNIWYHVALVRSGNTFTFYLNGVSDGTATSSASLDGGGTNTIAIARDGTDYYTGYMTDVRLVKGTAVYTTTFTPPTAPLTAISGTSLLTLQTNQPANNSTFLDNSTNNFLVTRNGNTTQGTFSPYGGNWSNYFGGQMASALSPSSTKFNLTGDFTLEAWAFPTALPGGDWGILDARVSGGSAAAWLFGISGAGKTQYYDGSARVGATTLTTNSWYHLAWVRSGSVLRGYVNGVLDYYNGAYGTGAISPGSTAPVIGTKDYGISSAWGTTGYISNLRVVNGTAVYTTSSTTVGATIFTPSTTPLTPVTNTVLLSCADSRFIDDSLNNYTITPSSSTISAQRFSPFNPSSVTPSSYSGYFDGSGDSLTTPTSTAFNIGAGDFTIEGWWNFSALPSGGINCNLFGFYGGTNYNPYMYLWGDGTITLRTAQTSGDIFNIASGFVVNTWYHLALVRYGNTYTLYKNGVSLASGTSTGVVNENKYIIFGDGAFYLNGYMSNVRVVKGIAVYTGAFTVPTSPLQATQSSGTNIAAITGTATSLLTCQSTAFIDNSTNNFAITAFGNSQPTIQNPFGYTSATTQGYTVSTIGGSGYFDGTGDYLTAPSNAAYQFGTGNFTIEYWIYQTASGSYRTVLDTRSSGTASPWACLINSSNQPYILITSDLTSSIAININTWNHVAIVRSGTNLSIYVNGVSGLSTTNSTSISPAGSLRVGLTVDAVYPMLGYLTDIRINKGTAVYKSNFVPSSAPLTAIQNTVLLTNMTSAGIYDSASMNDIETIGDAKIVSTETPYAGAYYSNLFGTGINIQAPNNAALVFGTGDFTVEMWINPTTWGASSDQLISGAGSNALQISKYGGNSYLGVAAQGTAWIITDAALPTTGVWTHVAVTRSGTSLKVFINGIQSGSTATNSTSFTVTNGIGAEITSNTYNFNGCISNVRMIKGTALYTANFTPPTAPLTAISGTSLLTCQSNKFVDNSTNAFALSLLGSPAIKSFNPFQRNSATTMYFDGTGDYLLIPSTQFQNYNFGTGDFTIECWLYQTAFNLDTVITASYTTWATSVNFYFGTRAGTPNILIFRGGNTTPISLNGNTGITASTWTHVAVSRASGVTRMFVGGVVQTATHTGSVNVGAAVQSMGIGAANIGNEPITGYIDDLRITKGVARYTANFTPSATAFLLK